MSASIEATLYTDPGCPWGYAAIPALRTLQWRYGEQLEWRLVLVGLSEDSSRRRADGFTPLRGALSQLRFRRYGMPLSPQPKDRLSATGRACRAIVAAGLLRPGDEWRVLRALQIANFTSPLLLDDDDQLREAIGRLSGIDADAVVSAIDDPAVRDAYEADRAETRSAAGSPAELQGKTARSDGPVRYTAPSVVFAREGLRLEAGGFQPIEAYDVLVCNLDPTLTRAAPPEGPLPALERFAEGLTTQEVAAILARGNDAPDRARAERELLELVGSGAAVRLPVGDDAIWRLAGAA